MTPQEGTYSTDFGRTWSSLIGVRDPFNRIAVKHGCIPVKRMTTPHLAVLRAELFKRDPNIYQASPDGRVLFSVQDKA